MSLREFRQDLSPLLQQAQRAGVRDRYPQGEDAAPVGNGRRG